MEQIIQMETTLSFAYDYQIMSGAMNCDGNHVELSALTGLWLSPLSSSETAGRSEGAVERDVFLFL